MSLNENAFRLVRPFLDRAADIGAACHDRAGVRLLDCGVRECGGTEAGLMMARAALAGLGDVSLVPPAEAGGSYRGLWDACPWPVVEVTSRSPVAACLASQYAGRKITANGFYAMASGPIRAAIGGEDLYEVIGLRERPRAAVGLLETSSLPPTDVCTALAADAGVEPGRLVLLAARTASIAGSLQVVARSLETALHKLHVGGFDLSRIVGGRGAAPLPPVPADDLVAIGRTNDAILYGGFVILEVTGDDSCLSAIGPHSISGDSPAHGEPFMTLFERAGRDFYALDPALFAPAVLEFVNVESGRRQRFGRLFTDLVTRSFNGPVAAETLES
jgi:methenyltetrahydromethanopterin cyclohydrolase